ncbi:NADH pyrophosphatase, variant 3 [Entomophthora muscae]|uniref:NADH pyrophosphatase, variant 3 n=1 Tax=Entomophthora muscae TaxID=34485 RepID=A0ACC2TW29_9FUNG|nr:NADH pyrophosphatase, variant 3 [Entomophthora muscae]
MNFQNFFAGNPLNRCGPMRRNTSKLIEDLKAPESKIILFNKDSLMFDASKKQVVEFNFSSLELLFKGALPINQSSRDASQLEKEQGILMILLGSEKGQAGLKATYWALQIGGNKVLADQVVQFSKEQSALGNEFLRLRPAAFSLPSSMAAIVAQARSILDWNAKNRFCSACGSPTGPAEVGYKRECLSSGDDSCISKIGVQNVSYPRTDAVAITCVVSKDGQRTLLGRKSVWPKKRFSCVAGFLEPSESIEEAAYREIVEETGVTVGKVLYHSSQPWPFPGNLMVGCHAQAVDETINPVDDELEEIKWFSREEVLVALHKLNDTQWLEASEKEDLDQVPLLLPPSYSIAFQLIKSWAEGASGNF